MRVFVYEYATAQPAPLALPDCLRREGAAMLNAIVADFRAMAGVEVLTMPSNYSGEEQAVFLELASQAERAMLIAPESNRELHRRVEWLGETKCRLLGPTIHALALLADKWRLHQLLTQSGIPSPCTWLATEVVDRALPDALVSKPRWGAGSEGVRLCHGTAGSARGAEWLIQEYVPGQPVSIAFLCGLERCLPLQPCSQILSNDGKFSYLGGEVPLRPELAQRATLLGSKALEAARAAASFVGYVSFDLVLGDAANGSRDYVIEMNLRLTTSYLGLRQLAVDNLAAVLLKLQREEPCTIINWRAGPVRFQP